MTNVVNILSGVGMVAGVATITAYIIAYALGKERFLESCKRSIWIIWFYTLGAFLAKEAGGVFSLVCISVLFVFLTLWLVNIWGDYAKIRKYDSK